MPYTRIYLLFTALLLIIPATSSAGMLQVGATAGGGGPYEYRPTIGRSQAVRALRHYQEDPIRNLESAETFMTFISEDSSVHVSISPSILPWIYRSHPPAYVQAVLLSAYMAGNFQAQLDDREVLDDPAAGLKYVVEVYELLKADDDSLDVPELDELILEKKEGQLDEAIQAMISGPAREYVDNVRSFED